MVAPDVTRRVLAALAKALPDEGRNLITRVEITKGWGDAIHVRIFSGASRTSEPMELRGIFTEAIDEALRDERHLVSLEWDYRPSVSLA
jgi:hypothetical protein